MNTQTLQPFEFVHKDNRHLGASGTIEAHPGTPVALAIWHPGATKPIYAGYSMVSGDGTYEILDTRKSTKLNASGDYVVQLVIGRQPVGHQTTFSVN